MQVRCCIDGPDLFIKQTYMGKYICWNVCLHHKRANQPPNKDGFDLVSETIIKKKLLDFVTLSQVIYAI